MKPDYHCFQWLDDITENPAKSKLRVEIMVKKIRTMLKTLNEIWVIGSEFFFGGGTRHPCGPNTSVIAL